MPRIVSQTGRSPAVSNGIDFTAIGSDALARSQGLVSRLLPNGRLEGREWTALNPTRDDRRLGSFRINLNTGHWSDFATGDKGGDLVSLVAYVNSTSQSDAARWIKDQLGGGAL